MENKEHSFVLKEDGKIYWIENMPDSNKSWVPEGQGLGTYSSALQSAIDNAIEVSNQNDVKNAFWNKWDEGEIIELGKVYSLQCRVEKKGVCGYTGTPCGSECYFCESDTIPVALVTFDSPLVEEQRETQDNNGFVIKINDGFCEWEYKILTTDESLCINSFIQVIEKQFNVKSEKPRMVWSKHSTPLNNNQ
jgi:hypothetical protein